jgi:hypothetical protein
MDPQKEIRKLLAHRDDLMLWIIAGVIVLFWLFSHLWGS